MFTDKSPTDHMQCERLGDAAGVKATDFRTINSQLEVCEDTGNGWLVMLIWFKNTAIWDNNGQ